MQFWSVRWGLHELMTQIFLSAQVDFTRSHNGETAVVERLEYDPNRSARIALVKYPAGGTLLSCVTIGPNLHDTESYLKPTNTSLTSYTTHGASS